MRQQNDVAVAARQLCHVRSVGKVEDLDARRREERAEERAASDVLPPVVHRVRQVHRRASFDGWKQRGEQSVYLHRVLEHPPHIPQVGRLDDDERRV